MGTEPIANFCREVETYLRKKNDGHLIRVVGPSFELVSRWAEQGVPLRVAFAGIDRYFERYYRKGPRRRPVKIDFCEADVLDVFDEWKRATGTISQPAGGQQPAVARHSLPEHLERVVTRLSSARAAGTIGEPFDSIIDRASAQLDRARSRAGGVRGEERTELTTTLDRLDREMLTLARASLDEAALRELTAEAERDLAAFRPAMAPEAYTRAHDAAVGHLVRTRLNLPTIAFS